MYLRLPHFVIGFHGCDRSLGERVLLGHTQLELSKNSYDWLGEGVYFWEDNYERAMEWAKLRFAQPAVLGAVIDLGNCLNLMDSWCIEQVCEQHKNFVDTTSSLGLALPQNTNLRGNTDEVLRHLDCAVINSLHEDRARRGETPFDSVRAVFTEGTRLYSQAGFHEKTHIQIAVRTPDCIRGVFAPTP